MGALAVRFTRLWRLGTTISTPRTMFLFVTFYTQLLLDTIVSSGYGWSRSDGRAIWVTREMFFRRFPTFCRYRFFDFFLNWITFPFFNVSLWDFDGAFGKVWRSFLDELRLNFGLQFVGFRLGGLKITAM